VVVAGDAEGVEVAGEAEGTEDAAEDKGEEEEAAAAGEDAVPEAGLEGTEEIDEGADVTSSLEETKAGKTEDKAEESIEEIVQSLEADVEEAAKMEVGDIGSLEEIGDDLGAAAKDENEVTIQPEAKLEEPLAEPTGESQDEPAIGTDPKDGDAKVDDVDPSGVARDDATVDEEDIEVPGTVIPDTVKATDGTEFLADTSSTEANRGSIGGSIGAGTFDVISEAATGRSTVEEMPGKVLENVGSKEVEAAEADIKDIDDSKDVEPSTGEADGAAGGDEDQMDDEDDLMEGVEEEKDIAELTKEDIDVDVAAEPEADEMAVEGGGEDLEVEEVIPDADGGAMDDAD